MIIYVKLLLTAIFWGGTFIAARVVAQNVGPFSASFLRFAIASIFLVFITIRMEGKIPRLKKHQILPVILLGLTGVFAYNVFFFSGLKTVTASRASIVIAMNPIFITIFRLHSFQGKTDQDKCDRDFALRIGCNYRHLKGNPLAIIQEGLGQESLHSRMRR